MLSHFVYFARDFYPCDCVQIIISSWNAYCFGEKVIFLRKLLLYCVYVCFLFCKITMNGCSNEKQPENSIQKEQNEREIEKKIRAMRAFSSSFSYYPTWYFHRAQYLIGDTHAKFKTETTMSQAFIWHFHSIETHGHDIPLKYIN